MPKKKNAGVPSLDLLYEKLLQADADSRGGSVLEICLHGNQQAIAAVPLRYRLIALGFVRSLSPEEVNRRLLDNGCAQLYARSFWEASVIYALRSGLSYGEWKNLLIQCMDLRESVMSKSAAFSSASISLSDIRRYVEDNSLRQADMAVTRHLTKELEQKLAGTDSGLQAFREFLISNIASFSTAMPAKHPVPHSCRKQLQRAAEQRIGIESCFQKSGQVPDRQKICMFSGFFPVCSEKNAQ